MSERTYARTQSTTAACPCEMPTPPRRIGNVSTLFERSLCPGKDITLYVHTTTTTTTTKAILLSCSAESLAVPLHVPSPAPPPPLLPISVLPSASFERAASPSTSIRPDRSSSVPPSPPPPSLPPLYPRTCSRSIYSKHSAPYSAGRWEKELLL